MLPNVTLSLPTLWMVNSSVTSSAKNRHIAVKSNYEGTSATQGELT